MKSHAFLSLLLERKIQPTERLIYEFVAREYEAGEADEHLFREALRIKGRGSEHASEAIGYYFKLRMDAVRAEFAEMTGGRAIAGDESFVAPPLQLDGEKWVVDRRNAGAEEELAHLAMKICALRELQTWRRRIYKRWACITLFLAAITVIFTTINRGMILYVLFWSNVPVWAMFYDDSKIVPMLEELTQKYEALLAESA